MPPHDETDDTEAQRILDQQFEDEEPETGLDETFDAEGAPF